MTAPERHCNFTVEKVFTLNIHKMWNIAIHAHERIVTRQFFTHETGREPVVLAWFCTTQSKKSQNCWFWTLKRSELSVVKGWLLQGSPSRNLALSCSQITWSWDFVDFKLPPAQCANNIILRSTDLFCDNSWISFCSRAHKWSVPLFSKWSHH